MKRKLLLIVFCISSVLAFSQVQKGSKLVGLSFGSASVTSSNSKTLYSNTTTVYDSKGTSLSFSINPSVAWFIQDGLAVGGSVSAGYYHSNSKSSNSSSTTTSDNTSNQPSLYIGPYARYYFGGSDKSMPFVQANFQIGIYGGKSISKSSSGSSSETATKPKGDWNAGLTIGYEQFINEYIGIYGSVGVNYGKSITDYDYKPSTGTGYTYTSEYSRIYFPVNVGLQIHIPVKGAN
jgi:hypothetical protein